MTEWGDGHFITTNVRVGVIGDTTIGNILIVLPTGVAGQGDITIARASQTALVATRLVKTGISEGTRSEG